MHVSSGSCVVRACVHVYVCVFFSPKKGSTASRVVNAVRRDAGISDWPTCRLVFGLVGSDH